MKAANSEKPEDIYGFLIGMFITLAGTTAVLIAVHFITTKDLIFIKEQPVHVYSVYSARESAFLTIIGPKLEGTYKEWKQAERRFYEVLSEQERKEIDQNGKVRVLLRSNF